LSFKVREIGSGHRATERRKVVQVAGDHTLRTDLGAVEDAVRTWLLRLLESSATS
jgi:hypothetical protein